MSERMERIHPCQARSCVPTSGSGIAKDAVGTFWSRRQPVCLFDGLSCCKEKETTPDGDKSHVESTNLLCAEATRDGKVSVSSTRRAVPRLQLSLRSSASFSRESLLYIEPRKSVISLRVALEHEKVAAFPRTPSTRKGAFYFYGRSISKRARFTKNCRRRRHRHTLA